MLRVCRPVVTLCLSVFVFVLVGVFLLVCVFSSDSHALTMQRLILGLDGKKMFFFSRNL